MATFRLLSLVAALLAVAAGAVHFYVMPEHWHEYWPFGVFFLAVGVAQVAGGLWLALKGGKGVYLVGVVGTLGVIVLYLYTRAVGVPLGPEAGEREAVSAIDLASKVVEALLVVSLLFLLRQRRDAAASTRSAVGPHSPRPLAQSGQGQTLRRKL